METETTESKKKNGLYAVIAFLVLAVVIETGFLISKMGGTKKVEEKAAVQHTPYSRLKSSPPSSPSYSQPAISSALPRSTDWDIYEEMRRMQEEMNRLFDEGFGRAMRSQTFQRPLASFFKDSFADFSPAVDLEETKEAYIAKADLPGLNKEKIKVSVSGNLLTIQGERQEAAEKEDAQQGYYAAERSYGSFARTVTLPGPVDESRVTAEYKDGVLTIVLPKKSGTETAAKQVQVV